MAIWDLQASAGTTGKSILWRGTWGSAVSYNPYDAVYSAASGSSYISKTNNANKVPASNPSDWDLMASVGAVGPEGPLGGLPVGAMIEYGGITEPEGWLWCAAQIIPRTGIFAPLFAAIGERWGAGDGVTTFQLPDFRGRVSAAPDDMGGTFAGRLTYAMSCNTTNGSTTLSHNEEHWGPITSGSTIPAGAFIYGPGIPPGTYIIQILSDTTCRMSNTATQTASGITVRFSMLNGLGLNGSGGEQMNRLTVEQMPVHSHGWYGAQSAGGPHFPGGSGWGYTSNSTGNAGGDQAHNNTQPTLLCYRIIKYASVAVAPPTPGTGDVTGPSVSTDGELAVFNGTSGKIIRRGGMLPGGYRLPRGWIAALKTSRNEFDIVNDIDIQDGECRDETNTVDIVLPSGMTKRLDAAWTAGTGQGGLDATGALANQTYHIFVMKNVNTTQVDILLSPSATAPMLPTGFTHKRRIASFIRSSGVVEGWHQDGDYFWRYQPDTGAGVNPVRVVAGVATLVAVPSLPTGIVGYTIQNILGVVDSGEASLMMSSPLLPDPNMGAPNYPYGPYTYTSYQNTGYSVMFDTQARVRVKSNTQHGYIYLTIFGWIDPRGKNN